MDIGVYDSSSSRLFLFLLSNTKKSAGEKMKNWKSTITSFIAQKDPVKKLFFKLWKNFPNGLTSKEVEEIIVMQSVRNKLEEHGYLYVEKGIIDGKEKTYYGLGPNGVSLISAWKTEALTAGAFFIACLALLFSVITFLFTIIF